MDFGGETKGSYESEKAKEKESSSTSGLRTEQLELDQKAIEKIIEDTLGGTSGLAGIFGGEQGTGMYNSSAANQAAGDLVGNLVGELAKITGKNVITEDEDTERNFRSEKDTGNIEQTVSYMF